MPTSQKLELLLSDPLLEYLRRLEQKLDKVLVESGQSTPTLGEFVPEEQAEKIIGKKTTWLYNKRKQGYLNTYKVGRKNFYKLSELQKLIEDEQE